MNDIVQNLKDSFSSNKTLDVNWRIQQLNALEKLLIENEKQICDALKIDLNKHENDSILSEVGMAKNAIIHALNHIEDYAKPKKVSAQFPINLAYSTYVQYQPYGVVLIMGAWNYPFQLCFVPLVGAIASGNCVLIKPSELAKKSADLIEVLVTKYLDKVNLQ